MGRLPSAREREVVCDLRRWRSDWKSEARVGSGVGGLSGDQVGVVWREVRVELRARGERRKCSSSWTEGVRGRER